MFRNQLRVRYRVDNKSLPEGCGCLRPSTRPSVLEGGTEGRTRILLVTPEPCELERICGPYGSVYRYFLNFLLEESPPIHYVLCPVCCVKTTSFVPDGIVEFEARCNLRKKKLHLPDLRIHDTMESPFCYTTFQKYSIRFERFIESVERSLRRNIPKSDK
jgi:hypothetical protein